MPNRSLYGAAQIARPIITFLPMNTENKTVLLITTDQPYMAIIRKVFADTIIDPFDFEWAGNFPDGIKRLNEGGIDAVLLDLSLANGEGIDTFDTLHPAAPQIPVLVLGGADDEDLARQAVQHGADDYLLKDYVNGHTLARALRNAITRRTVQDELFVERERAEVTLNSIGDAVLSTDNSGNVTYLNPVAEKMTGWTHAQASGRPITDVFRIIDGTTRAIGRNPVEVAIKQNKVLKLASDCVLVRRDGVEIAIEDSTAPIHDRTGQVTGAVIVFHDVSESREMTIKMSHLARHDPLTDLPNRTLLNERIHHAIALACRHKKQFAVLFLDVDRFKDINDSLGHPIGDRLLRSVAERLLACVRNTDTVSRLGGDEFVVLLSEIEHIGDANGVAEKMLTSLTAPHHITPHEINLTVSVGISVYPDDGQDAETLIRNADTALYHAKEAGRNNTKVFTKDMHTRSIEQRSLESGLRGALTRGEFELHYQPKVRLATGEITGVEALLRWHHPVRGDIPPELFIPIAEESRLIVQIGEWVLREACTQGQAWRNRGLAIDQIAVNISAIEFQTPGFFDRVTAILTDTGFDPRCLELEMTESVLMEHAESTNVLLNRLKSTGLRLAIDDFGTGYSSLSYLSRFPVDTLKIDQSFVHKMTSEPSGATIVSTVISMGRSLNFRVVAEGVETPEQLAFLLAQHCEEGQGYHFSKPLCAKEFSVLLATGSSRIATAAGASSRRDAGNGSWKIGAGPD